MKIRTFLVCFLAVCAVSLTSCKGNKDYTEKFVGNYEMTLTPNVEIAVESEIPGVEDMLDLGAMGSMEPMEGVLCSIEKVGEDNDVKVTLSYEDEDDGEILPLFVFTGTCDKTGLYLNSLNIGESIGGDIADMGDATMEMIIGSSTIEAPVNGKINWTSSVSGSMNLNISTEFIELPIAINITGSIDFAGVKK